MSGNTTIDGMALILHLDTAFTLSILKNNLSDLLIQNILCLEVIVGDAATAEEYLRKNLLDIQYSFYGKYMSDIGHIQAKE